MPHIVAPRASDRATLLKSPTQATVAPGEVAELLAHGEQVGQRLARVAPVGQEVDDRDRRRRRPGSSSSAWSKTRPPSAAW